MSTPCCLLHIGPCCVAEAKGVEELELRLKAIESEIIWLKKLSRRYKDGASNEETSILIQMTRYVRKLDPPVINPDIFELWCRTFNFDVQTILYREERPADDKFGFPDVFPKMFSPRGFLKSGCKTYEEFCTKSLVKIGEDQTIEAPEGSPWAEWAKQHDSRQTFVRILVRGYNEPVKESGHES